MDNELIFRNILDEANEFYSSAQEELCRPEEDVVPFMICKCAYKSVSRYLAAFLLQKGMEINDSTSLESLLNKCREIDSKFLELDLNTLFYGNAHLDEAAVADWDTMQEYLEVATRTRDLITKDIQ